LGQDLQDFLDFFPGFAPVRHRPPEADSGEAGGEESLEPQSPPANNPNFKQFDSLVDNLVHKV
jgi:hypothetical protein